MHYLRSHFLIPPHICHTKISIFDSNFPTIFESLHFDLPQLIELILKISMILPLNEIKQWNGSDLDTPERVLCWHQIGSHYRGRACINQKSISHTQTSPPPGGCSRVPTTWWSAQGTAPAPTSPSDLSAVCSIRDQVINDLYYYIPHCQQKHPWLGQTGRNNFFCGISCFPMFLWEICVCYVCKSTRFSVTFAPEDQPRFPRLTFLSPIQS